MLGDNMALLSWQILNFIAEDNNITFFPDNK